MSRFFLFNACLLTCLLLSKCTCKCPEVPFFAAGPQEKEWICYSSGQKIRFRSNLGKVIEYEIKSFERKVAGSGPLTKPGAFEKPCNDYKFEIYSCEMSSKDTEIGFHWALHMKEYAAAYPPSDSAYIEINRFLVPGEMWFSPLYLPIAHIDRNQPTYTDVDTLYSYTLYYRNLTLQGKAYTNVYITTYSKARGDKKLISISYNKEFGIVAFETTENEVFEISN
jgi:hypothetical protein